MFVSDEIAVIDFVRRSDVPDKYRVQIALDKINFPTYRDHKGRDVRPGYTGIFVSDNPLMREVVHGPTGRFTLADDIRVYLEVELKQIERAYGPYDWVGQGEVRFIVGAVAQWNGRSHFVEVNLMRTPGFDRCGPEPGQWRPDGGAMAARYGTSICENHPSGDRLVYDHRYATEPGGGTELVYFNGLRLPTGALQEPRLGAGLVSIDIPIARLFRDYPWINRPTSWAAVKSWDPNDRANGEIGIYFGIEIYGRARAWFNVQTLNLYRAG